MADALDGKVAVVTGGASGIGLATARRLVAEGARVVVVDFNDDAGRAAASELDGHYVRADVGEPNDWRFVVAEAEEHFGGVDLAHLNAGVTTGESAIDALTDEQYRRIMGANVDGVVFGMRALVPEIERRGGGCIVATASLAGLIAFALDPIYTLTKHAVVGLVRSVAPQLAARGIRVNAVCPGIVDTPLLGEDGRTRLREFGFPLIPADDIAAAVVAAITGKANGDCFVCQPSLPPTPFVFGGVPGPRGEATGLRPPGML